MFSDAASVLPEPWKSLSERCHISVPCFAYVSEELLSCFPTGTTVLFLIVYFNRPE